MLKTILLSLSLSGGPAPVAEQVDIMALSAGEHVQQSMQVMHKEMQDALKAELAETVKRTLEDTANAYRPVMQEKDVPDQASFTVYSPR